MHNDKLYNSYLTADIIRVMMSERMGCTRKVACMREPAYMGLMGKPEGKRSLGIS